MNLARLLLTANSPMHRDPDAALQLAARVNDATGGRDPRVLATLAEALAATGQPAKPPRPGTSRSPSLPSPATSRSPPTSAVDAHSRLADADAAHRRRHPYTLKGRLRGPPLRSCDVVESQPLAPSRFHASEAELRAEHQAARQYDHVGERRSSWTNCRRSMSSRASSLFNTFRKSPNTAPSRRAAEPEGLLEAQVETVQRGHANVVVEGVEEDARRARDTSPLKRNSRPHGLPD